MALSVSGHVPVSGLHFDMSDVSCLHCQQALPEELLTCQFYPVPEYWWGTSLNCPFCSEVRLICCYCSGKPSSFLSIKRLRRHGVWLPGRHQGTLISLGFNAEGAVVSSDESGFAAATMLAPPVTGLMLPMTHDNEKLPASEDGNQPDSGSLKRSASDANFDNDEFDYDAEFPDDDELFARSSGMSHDPLVGGAVAGAPTSVPLVETTEPIEEALP